MPPTLTTRLCTTLADRQAYRAIWQRYLAFLMPGASIIEPPYTPEPGSKEFWGISLLNQTYVAVGAFHYEPANGIEIDALGIIDPPLVAQTTVAQRNTLRQNQLSTLVHAVNNKFPNITPDDIFGYVLGGDAELQAWLQAQNKPAYPVTWVTQPDGRVLYSASLSKTLVTF